MFRRLPALRRASAAAVKPATRQFTKPSATTAASSQLGSSNSNVILELDTKQVGNEIRKRGLSGAVQGRDGGMDRVSLSSSNINGELTNRTLSSDYFTLLEAGMKSSDTSESLLLHPSLQEVVFSPRPSLPFSSKSAVTFGRRRKLIARIGGAILTNELDDLALSLSFLNRLGLYPVVLHGAGPQL
jgi:N-acetyl-gamma-glutamyl-phosphate reductase/acetylglutamate kinase